MFEIWKKGHGSLNPKATLADAAEAIPNGAKEAFGTTTRRLMCYPHVNMVCFMFFYCLYALLLDLMFDDLRGKRRMIYAIHRTVVYGLV